MAFVFLVEDGTGLPLATSFAAVAEADDYFAVDTNFAATWDDFTEQQKELRLAWSSRILDQKINWKGRRADEESGLRWPREGVYDADGLLIESDVIPRQLKQAVFELLKYNEGNDPTTSQDVEYIRRLQVDVLEIEYQEMTGQVTLPPLINDILRGLGSWPTSGHRFARIIRA